MNGQGPSLTTIASTQHPTYNNGVNGQGSSLTTIASTQHTTHNNGMNEMGSSRIAIASTQHATSTYQSIQSHPKQHHAHTTFGLPPTTPTANLAITQRASQASNSDVDGEKLINPGEAFTQEDYRSWNLDIRAEKVTELFNGKSEDYESWRDLMVDLCSAQRFGWRAILDHLVTVKTPLTMSTITSTPLHLGLTGPQHVVRSQLFVVTFGTLHGHRPTQISNTHRRGEP